MDRIQDFEVNSPRWLSLEDFEGEEWKKVSGYEERYMVSNYGRVKSYHKHNNHCCPKILKQYYKEGNRCYWKVYLFKDGKGKTIYVHRLVAKAFIPNPKNLPEVNHKDENKLNPHKSNLEWCDRKYNCNFGTLPNRMREHANRRWTEYIENENRYGIKHRMVHQYDLNGNYIASYNSQKEAGLETGINKNSICDACKERALSAGGFIWTYTKNIEEVKKKVKLAKGVKGRNRKNTLPIEQYTLDNKYICTYKNALSAAKQNGLCYTSILMCAKEKWKKYGGFIWKYKTS